MIAAAASEFRILDDLLKRRALNAITIANLRREAELLGRPMVDLLRMQDIVSEEELAQIYADLSGLRYVDLTQRRPAASAALALPENDARRKLAVIFGEVSGFLVVAVADPLDASVRAMLSERIDRPIQYVVSPAYQIRDAIDRIYADTRTRSFGAAASAVSAPPMVVIAGGELNIVEVLDSIIDEAVDRRASDIHLEPERDRFRVRFRIDGRMVEARAFVSDAAAPLTSRIKILSNLDITERRRPQDGRFTQRSFDQEIDVRVAVIPTARGERIALRLLAPERARVTWEQLGMSAEMRKMFDPLIARPHGLVLITGPTGSGKTTTLYTALQRINSVDKHIITVEDPVEYQIQGVNQVAVDPEYGVSFPQALRSILRHNPDIIMVGEIRDEITAHLALEASLTGHLVFSTLHTNSAVGAVTRLLEMGCEPYLVAHAIIGVMAQRLVRKICTQCRREYECTEPEKEILGVPKDRFGVKLYRGGGCARCLRTGYYDRIGVFELVVFDQDIIKLVMKSTPADELQRHAMSHGAITLREDAMRKAREGLTTLDEALRVTVAERFNED